MGKHKMTPARMAALRKAQRISAAHRRVMRITAPSSGVSHKRGGDDPRFGDYQHYVGRHRMKYYGFRSGR